MTDIAKPTSDTYFLNTVAAPIFGLVKSSAIVLTTLIDAGPFSWGIKLASSPLVPLSVLVKKEAVRSNKALSNAPHAVLAELKSLLDVRGRGGIVGGRTSKAIAELLEAPRSL